MPGAVFLRGDSVTLRTVEESDVEFLRDTLNDPEVREGLATVRPLNRRQEEAYFEERISSEETVSLMICRDDEPVGNVGLNPIDQQAGNCELGAWLDPDHHGRGYGTEASRLLVGYAFDELRMHRVSARILADNRASRNMCESLGFEHEGVHREEAFTGGEYVDVHYYGVLADEWEG